MLKKTFALLLCLSICCLAFMPALAKLDFVEPVPFPDFDAENLLDEEGAKVTQDIFAEADITLVNFWATWCGPCVAELPELAQLSTLTEGKVQVVGVLLDGVDQFTGKRDDSAIEAMHILVEDAGVEYPVLLPEGILLELGGVISSIPTTFLVDREGITYAVAVGGNDAAGWIADAQTVAEVAYPNEKDIIGPLPK